MGTLKMKSLWLLLFGLTLVLAVDNQTDSSPGANTTESTETEHTYKLKDVIDWVPMTTLYKMARGFANKVGPSEPLIDDIIELVNGNDTLRLPEDYPKLLNIVKKEAGFMACLAFGIILFFGLGISGAIFCCCRCCCNGCGGKKIQSPNDDSGATRRTYFTLLFITMLFMLAAVICGYASTTIVSDAVVDSEDKIVDILSDTSTFFNSTSKTLKQISDEGLQDSIKNVTDELDGIKTTFGMPLQNYAVDQIGIMAGLAEVVDTDCANITKAKKTLDEIELTDLNRRLDGVKQNLKEIRKDCGADPNCGFIQDDADKAEKPDTSFIPTLPTGLKAEVKKFEPKVQNIAQDVEDKTKNSVRDIKKKLDDVVKDFNSGEFQKIINDTAQATNFVPNATKDVQKAFKNINEFKNERKYGLAAVVSLITLPVLVILLGMCCGCTGHRSSRHPAERGCLSNWGGCTIITGVYLLFFITGIPILATTVLFQLGGHLETHVCTVMYEEKLQSVDKYYQLAKKQLNLQDDIFNHIQPSRTFLECQKGSSIITALNLTDIDKELDVQGKINMTEQLDKFDFDVSDGVKIDPDQVSSKVVELNKLDDQQFKNLTNQVLEGFVFKDKLKDWIQSLKLTKDNIISDDIKNRLEKQITELENIGKSIETDVLPKWDEAMDALNPVDIVVLKANGRQINQTSSTLVDDIAHEANKLKKDFEKRILALADNTADSLKNKVTCEPIWLIYDNTRHLICRDLLDPLNAYWFCLGWALFFLLFAIGFATRLSHFYMRMSDMKRTRWEDDHLDPRDLAPTEKQPCIPMKQNDPYYFQNQGFQTPPNRPPSYHYPQPSYGPPPPPNYGTRTEGYDYRQPGYE